MSGKGMFQTLSIAAVVLSMAAVDQAFAQRGRGGMQPQGVNPLQVVTNEAVQKELGLSQEKIDKIKDLGNDVREEVMTEIAGAGINLGGDGDLSREEQQKRRAEMTTKMAEVMKKVNEKFLPKLGEVLDKKEMTRLHEIAIQAAGSSAFQDAEVAKELALTTDQQDKIKKIGAEYQEKGRALFTSGGDPEEARAKSVELRKEQGEKVTAVLTADQKEKLEKMKGKPFDVSKLQMRRRRPQQ